MASTRGIIDMLTDTAKRALLSAGTNRQGATVVLPVGPLRRSLESDGLIGPGGGLTRTGTIVRQKLMDDALDSAF